MAVAAPIAGQSTPQSAGQLQDLWRRRIVQAREYRKQFEPTWLSDLAFANGQQWQVYNHRSQRMVHIGDVDPKYRDRELYTADRINEQRQAQLGELSNGDDRPELLIARDSETAEALQREINAAVAYGWDYEWGADQALMQARRLCLDMGTAAIRCRFDKTQGPVLQDQVPHLNGQPVFDLEQAHGLFANGPRPDVEMRSIHEGRTIWEPLSALNLLTPPGVNHEDKFPWEIVVAPTLIDYVEDVYGVAPGSLTEDADISSVIGLSTAQQATVSTGQTPGRLRNHVWLFTCYQRPSRQHPNGQVVVLATNSFQLVHVDDQLPYQSPDGRRRTGISYLHWWRRDDAFYSRSFIQPMKDPQRLINRRETQNAEIIDKGMPKVYTKEGDLIHDPTGAPLENVELKSDAAQPVIDGGVGPGPWMYGDIDHHVDNLAHASTLSPLRLGENPQNVKTYAQLALLNENESAKRTVINQEHQLAISQLVQDSVWDITQYWPDEKKIVVPGDTDETIGQQVFQKSKIPPFYVLKIPKGSAQPRSQGAELTKIDAIWAAAVATGVAAQPIVNERWVRWYTQSLNAGQALDLPDANSDSQSEVAGYENFQMLEQGDLPQPEEYDLAAVHIPIHREAQDRARAAGNTQAYQLIQQHVELHIQMNAYTRKALRVYDPTDAQDQASDIALDEDQALRENQLMIAGQPLNPEAMQQAAQSLQQRLDPDTGQPLPPGANVQAILLHASLKPTLTENLEVHLDRHGKVIKSKAFAGWPAPMRGRFLDHYDQTRDLYLSLPMMPAQVEAPRVTLALRESVGASTVADVLRRAGVPEADPQTIAAEPPMENMVQRTDPPPATDPQIIDHGPRPPL